MEVAQENGVGRYLRFLLVVILAGIGAGLVAAALSLFLHGLELLAFGREESAEDPGFGGVVPWRIVLSLAIAGVVGGVGWWALRRWGRKIVPVTSAVDGTKMPPISTIVNALLQIAIVGLGASIGREVAPRELGALVGGWLSDVTGLTARERKIIVASAAGAGLAGVYSVPLGGAVFALEILLAQFSVLGAVAAFLTSAISTLVSSLVVPTSGVYIAPMNLELSPSLVVWAIILGPIAGFLGLRFMRAASWVEKRRPTGWRLMVVMPIVFTAIGVIAIWLPQIMGNGRDATQFAIDVGQGNNFNGSWVSLGGIPLDSLNHGHLLPDALPTAIGGTTILMVLALLVLKPLATIATIGSGAVGGTLTPSLAAGSLLGVAFGALWSLAWPGVPFAAFALIGAAAFLSSTMRAPITAFVLVVELSHQGFDLFVPTMIAIAGAVASERFFTHRKLFGID